MRQLAKLGELTQGALAEMRALIFELRPDALTQEGLVSALSKQAAPRSATSIGGSTNLGTPPRVS